MVPNKKTFIVGALILSLGALLAVYFGSLLILGLNGIIKTIPWSKADPTVMSAVITATVGAFASIVAVVWGAGLTKKREIEFEIRKRKADAYRSFVDSLLETLSDTKKSDHEKAEVYLGMTKNFGRDVILWGSDELIKSYGDFRDLGRNPPNDVAVVFAMEEILLAIRKDLGHKNRNIKSGTLLTFFIKESKATLNAMRSSSN